MGTSQSTSHRGQYDRAPQMNRTPPRPLQQRSHRPRPIDAEKMSSGTPPLPSSTSQSTSPQGQYDTAPQINRTPARPLQQRSHRPRPYDAENEQLARDLYDAVNDNDLDRVRSLLGKGADPNHELYWSGEWRWSSWKFPPLHRACQEGYLPIVKVLISHGADVERCDDLFERFPLHYACRQGQKDVVMYLVSEAKCTVDVRDNDGTTPLHWACWGGHKDVVQYLVEDLKCYVDVRDNDGMTPLHNACLGGHKDVVQYLMEDLKCDVDVRDNDGQAPLHYACQGGHKDFVQYLVEDFKCDVDVTDDEGKTPLDVARENDYTEIIDYLESQQQSAQQANAGLKRATDSTDGQPAADTIQVETPLTEDEVAALQKLLQENNIKLSFGEGQPTFEGTQQLLREKGHKDLATNLKSEITKVIEEQQKYMNQLEKMMTDEDTFYICCLRLLLVGPPFVGKTTTLNRLLRVFENIRTGGDKAKQRSTLLANCTQALALVHEDTAEWLASQDLNEQTKLLFRYLSGLDTEVPTEEPASSSQHRETPELKHKSKPAAQTEEMAFTQKSHKLAQPISRVDRQATAYRHNRLTAIKSRLQNVIKSGDYSKWAHFIGSTLLNISDIGGQPGFLEMLPALMKGPAMYLVFLDLSKELDKPYKIPFSRDDTVITPYDAKHTVLATISQILSSIASVHCISEQPATLRQDNVGGEKLRMFQEVTPVAAVVGTHRDKLKDPEREIKRKDEALKKITEQFDKILVTPSSTGTFNASFFTVDNMDGTEQSEMAPLRDFLSKIFNTHFKGASLPIKKKWLLLGIILRREFKIASTEDCYDVGDILDMKEEEVRHCLKYLHDIVGTLMFYTDIPDDWFKTHVICSPQVVFDSTSKLIVASLCTLHCEGYVIEFVRKELIKKGQFTLESIEKFCHESDQVASELQNEELIPAKHLIELLKHVNLLSPITHSVGGKSKKPRVTYLMPTILECALPVELCKPPMPDANNPEPIHITFGFGFVPTGAFCGLITRIVSDGPQKILGLTWTVVEDGVKRNCVSFCVDNVNKVTLLSHERSYEIRVSGEEPDTSLCSDILTTILYVLKCLYQHLAPLIAFRCPCSEHSTNVYHLCVLSEGRQVRFVCSGKSVPLRAEQQVWFGKLAVPGTTSSLAALRFAGKQALGGFSFHWSKVGDEDFEPPVNPKKPNVLTFQSISEGDYGYYQCEVKEAGKVVLTVYKALYKTTNPEAQAPSLAAEHVSTTHHQSLSAHPSIMTSIGGPTNTASNTGLTTTGHGAGGKVVHFLKTSNLNIDAAQLDTEIELADMAIIAQHFDGLEQYMDIFGLYPAEQDDIKRIAYISGTKVAFTECLKLWNKRDPSAATYRALVDILLKLGKEEIAYKVCEYVFPKHK